MLRENKSEKHGQCILYSTVTAKPEVRWPLIIKINVSFVSGSMIRLRVSRWANEDHIHTNKLNMADFILHMPLSFLARVFGNPAGDPVLLKSRGVTLLRDTPGQASFFFFFF